MSAKIFNESYIFESVANKDFENYRGSFKLVRHSWGCLSSYQSNLFRKSDGNRDHGEKRGLNSEPVEKTMRFSHFVAILRLK